MSTGVGDLIKVLPTGTVFLYQFIGPILTNSGHCDKMNKVLVIIFIVLCTLSCFLSSFTDSYINHEGDIQWTFVTPSGMWPKPKIELAPLDMEHYKLQIGDVIHAMFSTAVFVVLVVVDSNVMNCMFPKSKKHHMFFVQTLPPIVGATASIVFVSFPNHRHGIGYHATSTAKGVKKLPPTT